MTSSRSSGIGTAINSPLRKTSAGLRSRRSELESFIPQGGRRGRVAIYRITYLR
jgi:hypothetical protein